MHQGKDAVPGFTPGAIRQGNRNLGVVVAATLEARIASGEMAPGYRFPPERELAVMLDVSRTTLREAMTELESKGLVERRPGRGTVVMPPQSEVQDLVRGLSDVEQGLVNVSELRALLEPGIAGYAAIRARPSNLLRMEAVLAQTSEFLAPSESLRLDIEFHSLLAQSARNPLLHTILEVSNGWARDVRLDSHRTRAARRSSLHGHRAILDQVAARNVRGAQDAMSKHLADVSILISESIMEPATHSDADVDRGPDAVSDSDGRSAMSGS